jgi:beta-lactamase superfamily II metal-dependent hydrolase
MPTNQLEPPTPDELEISIFGPGYGESIVIHLGNGQWVLVDSCLEPTSGRPASLQYLQNLNIDIVQSVKLIVATHWHDDHIRGISTVLGECTSAQLAISAALDAQDFLKLVQFYSERVMGKSSGLDEFVRIFQILESRKQKGTKLNSPKLAISDRLLYSDEIPLATGKVEAKVFSLSPSDASKMLAMLAFADLLPVDGERKKRITSFTPNHASVVLWVEVGDHRLLLGADLERTSDPKTGWSVIVNDSTVVSGEAKVFKVPHHGAESAYEPSVWSQLLSRDPFAIVSPFSLGDKLLPTYEDVRRITTLTNNAYITARPVRRRHRWTNKVVRELVGDVTRDIHDVHCGWGQIRLRRGITDWSTP